MNVWAFVLAAAVVAAVLRLAPELWLAGRAPPRPIAETLPWLPVAVAGTFVGLLHIAAPAALRLEYFVAAVPAGLTLLWRRTFYIPLAVGALTLALIRHFDLLA